MCHLGWQRTWEEPGYKSTVPEQLQSSKSSTCDDFFLLFFVCSSLIETDTWKIPWLICFALWFLPPDGLIRSRGGRIASAKHEEVTGAFLLRTSWLLCRLNKA